MPNSANVPSNLDKLLRILRALRLSDNLDPSTKLFLIPRNINRNLKALCAEMRKCRILCANCHRVHSRTQWNDGTTYKPNPRKTISDLEV